MDRIIDRLPSPGGLALWLYAICFALVPAILAWKGLAYVVGIVVFAVGLRPHVDSLVAGRTVTFGLRWKGEHHVRAFHLAIKSERWVVKILSWGLMLLTILVLPILVFVLQQQGQVFVAQLEAQMPAIITAIGDVLDFAHEQLPGVVPDANVDQGAKGWSGLGQLFTQVAGDAVNDIKDVMKSIFSSALKLLGILLGDWVKLCIAAIIVGTILAGWDKEVKMHRRLVSDGIRHPRLRRNVLRYGELYQSGVSLFMIGYLEVAATLSILYAIGMTVLPLGLGLGAILFMAVILGFVTAIPKIGGIGGMAIAFLMTVTNINPGLGWFGYEVVSFGTGFDVLIRAAALMALSKLMGLLEAYSYTPEIVGKKLGLTKMQIIATVLIWAIGAGFFGMIWGILISLTFQAAMRLAEEDAAERAAIAAAEARAESAAAE